jgi:hypothetical protein
MRAAAFSRRDLKHGVVRFGWSFGIQAFTCIWIKNNRLVSAKRIYNGSVFRAVVHPPSTSHWEVC